MLRRLWPLGIFVAIAAPAQASGALWCNIEDAHLKLDFSTGVTHGMGGPFFQISGTATVLSPAAPPELRIINLDTALVHHWLDGDEAKLSFYKEAEKGDSIVSASIEIETGREPQSEDGYAGSYRMVVYPGSVQPDGNEFFEVTGSASCGAE